MSHEIIVPSLGESVTEAKVAAIIRESGASVRESEEVIELETEKVNQVLYAPTNGVLTWSVNVGDMVQIGQKIGEVEAKEVSKASPPKPKSVDTPVAIPSPVEPKKSEQPLVEGSVKGRRKMTKIRQTIAKRLVESLRSSAMLTTFNEVDMSAIVDLRATHKESFVQKHGVKLGLMSFFVKATTKALQEFPDLNSRIEGDEIVTPETYDIGVAVGGAKGGLVVPVLRKAEVLRFSEIEKAIGEFAVKAREGKLSYNEISGGTFTITNGGIYGSLLSTPLLNPPQSGILGMHKIEKRAVVVNDTIVIRPMMYLALSYDHRLVDGKEAVSFLVRVKELLEQPSLLQEELG